MSHAASSSSRTKSPVKQEPSSAPPKETSKPRKDSEQAPKKKMQNEAYSGYFLQQAERLLQKKPSHKSLAELLRMVDPDFQTDDISGSKGDGVASTSQAKRRIDALVKKLKVRVHPDKHQASAEMSKRATRVFQDLETFVEKCLEPSIGNDHHYGADYFDQEEESFSESSSNPHFYNPASVFPRSFHVLRRWPFLEQVLADWYDLDNLGGGRTTIGKESFLSGKASSRKSAKKHEEISAAFAVCANLRLAVLHGTAPAPDLLVRDFSSVIPEFETDEADDEKTQALQTKNGKKSDDTDKAQDTGNSRGERSQNAYLTSVAALKEELLTTGPILATAPISSGRGSPPRSGQSSRGGAAATEDIVVLGWEQQFLNPHESQECWLVWVCPDYHHSDLESRKRKPINKSEFQLRAFPMSQFTLENARAPIDDEKCDFLKNVPCQHGPYLGVDFSYQPAWRSDFTLKTAGIDLGTAELEAFLTEFGTLSKDVKVEGLFGAVDSNAPVHVFDLKSGRTCSRPGLLTEITNLGTLILLNVVAYVQALI